jgi:hypothetical protein
MSFIKYKLFTIFLTLFLMLVQQELVGQDVEYVDEYNGSNVDVFTPDTWIADFSIEILDAVNMFGTNLPDKKVGVSVGLYKQIRESTPIFAGIDFYYSGISSASLDFATERETASTSMIGVDFSFKYFPNFYFWKIEPYIQPYLGLRSFLTSVNINDISSGQNLSYNVEEFSMNLSYGFGVGFQTFVFRNYALNTQFIFQPGLVSEYYVENGETTGGFALDLLDFEKSATDMIRYQIGLSIIF